MVGKSIELFSCILKFIYPKFSALNTKENHQVDFTASLLPCLSKLTSIGNQRNEVTIAEVKQSEKSRSRNNDVQLFDVEASCPQVIYLENRWLPVHLHLPGEQMTPCPSSFIQGQWVCFQHSAGHEANFVGHFMDII